MQRLLSVKVATELTVLGRFWASGRQRQFRADCSFQGFGDIRSIQLTRRVAIPASARRVPSLVFADPLQYFLMLRPRHLEADRWRPLATSLCSPLQLVVTLSGVTTKGSGRWQTLNVQSFQWLTGALRLKGPRRLCLPSLRSLNHSCRRCFKSLPTSDIPQRQQRQLHQRAATGVPRLA